MLIKTKRLKLTNFQTDYAEEFTKALNDPRIFLYLPESVPDLNDIERLIQWFIERDKKNVKNGFTGTNLAITIKATQKIIGWCGIQPFDPIPDKKEIFFGLSPAYWNKGYMTEAAGAVLRYGFETLNLKEIVAGVKPKNSASIAVLEKTGLVFQDTIKKVPKGSEFYLGELYYSITKDQYLMNKVQQANSGFPLV
jgi:ribosomal-protein-alanine N-acetyltransferase